MWVSWTGFLSILKWFQFSVIHKVQTPPEGSPPGHHWKWRLYGWCHWGGGVQSILQIPLLRPSCGMVQGAASRCWNRWIGCHRPSGTLPFYPSAGRMSHQKYWCWVRLPDGICLGQGQVDVPWCQVSGVTDACAILLMKINPSRVITWVRFSDIIWASGLQCRSRLPDIQ